MRPYRSARQGIATFWDLRRTATTAHLRHKQRHQHMSERTHVLSLFLHLFFYGRIDNSWRLLQWKMTGEAPEIRSDKRKPSWTLFEHQTASISKYQHLLALIRINQHRSAAITISQQQSACQSASINICNWLGNYIYMQYTGINAPNFWGAWGGYREILRSVRRLCEKVVRGRLQELLSELTKNFMKLMFVVATMYKHMKL